MRTACLGGKSVRLLLNITFVTLSIVLGVLLLRPPWEQYRPTHYATYYTEILARAAESRPRWEQGLVDPPAWADAPVVDPDPAWRAMGTPVEPSPWESDPVVDPEATWRSKARPVAPGRKLTPEQFLGQASPRQTLTDEEVLALPPVTQGQATATPAPRFDPSRLVPESEWIKQQSRDQSILRYKQGSVRHDAAWFPIGYDWIWDPYPPKFNSAWGEVRIERKRYRLPLFVAGGYLVAIFLVQRLHTLRNIRANPIKQDTLSCG
jgi:hypothetical protein